MNDIVPVDFDPLGYKIITEISPSTLNNMKDADIKRLSPVGHF
jgi:hypothetical protein